MQIQTKALVLGVGALGASAFVWSNAAQASIAKPVAAGCAAPQICVYVNSNYGGGVYSWIQGDADPDFNSGQTFSNGVKLNDNISSLVNKSSKPVVFCTDKNFAGTCRVYPAGKSSAQVPENDAYSSMSANPS